MKLDHLKRSLLGIISVIIISLVIICIFNIPLSEIIQFTPQLLFLFIAMSMIRLLSQGIRFHILLKIFNNPGFTFSESVIIRGSSEFFALTTLPFLADEAARTFMLTERGLPFSTSFWITFIELLLDTLIGAILSLASGVYAFLSGERLLASTILTISSFQVTLSIIFISLSKNKDISLFKKIRLPLSRKLQSTQYISSMFKDGGKEFFRIIGSIFSLKYLIHLAMLVLLSVAIIIVPAIVLYEILTEYGYSNFLNVLYAFRSGETLGVLPITAGGAGLTEIGVYLYLVKVLGVDSLSSVIKWRIATYYITLIITSFMLIYTSVKYFRKFLTKTW